MKDRQPNPNYRPPASVHIPEQASVPPMPKVERPQPSALITITVAEYHFLTKAATLLEAIMHAPMHDRHALVEAAQKTLALPEAGAEE